MSFRKLWTAFALVVVLSFAVLGWTGFRIYQSAPPVPERVLTTDGRQLIGPGEIHGGQNVWQSMGGMEVGGRDRLLVRSQSGVPADGTIETFRWLRVVGDTRIAEPARAGSRP